MIHKQQLSGEITQRMNEHKLHLKEMELNSLLEVTQAINSNLPETALYKIYHFTLLANLKIKKLALYVLEQDWQCKVNYGTTADFKKEPITASILNLKEITDLPDSGSTFNEFDMVIPVNHKDQILAYVLAGGFQELDETSKADLAFLQTFSNIIIVAIENKKLARRQLEQEAFKKELEIARDVQALLFPKSLPDSNQINIKASYHPHFSIGGDYYDYIDLGKNRFLICIADVSGKGIPAALLMSNFQASLRTISRQTDDLVKIINELNYIIRINSKGERFITFFTAIVDLEARKMKYINAGHNPPILLNGAKVELLERGTTILGIFDKLPFIEEVETDLESDALLFLYTDGLTEVSSEQDEEFGIDRLIKFLEENRKNKPEINHQLLYTMIDKFRGQKNFPDDITYVTCKLELSS